MPASLTNATASVRQPGDDAVAFSLAAMVVIDRHRRGRRHVGEQFGGDALVLGKDQARAAQGIGGARGEIGKIADRRRHDIEAGGQGYGH